MKKTSLLSEIPYRTCTHVKLSNSPILETSIVIHWMTMFTSKLIDGMNGRRNNSVISRRNAHSMKRFNWIVCWMSCKDMTG